MMMILTLFTKSPVIMSSCLKRTETTSLLALFGKIINKELNCLLTTINYIITLKKVSELRTSQKDPELIKVIGTPENHSPLICPLEHRLFEKKRPSYA